MIVNERSLLILLSLISLVFCSTCKNPKVTSSYFTSQDATVVTHIAYISEFTVECESGELGQIYADVGGHVIPVSAIGNNKFQVSWTEEVGVARRGSIGVRVYDEDGFASLRKAIRSGEDLRGVKALFDVGVYHVGAFNGPWLKSMCPICKNPEVTYTYFTTQDARIVTNIAYISEFYIKCTNGIIPLLYAEVNGVFLPVSWIFFRKYQVSWTEDIASATKGEITLNVYDEDGYNSVKKILRSGGNPQKITPFFVVKITHPGAYNGPWLRGEFVAVFLFLCVAFIAINYKMDIID